MSVRACALIPTFDNPATVRRVVQDTREHLEDVLVIDDGSGPKGRRAVDDLRRAGLAQTVRLPTNGGKGAAIKLGLRRAQKLGSTHAVLLDADGQHATEDLPRMLDAARQQPEALVLGQPIFDETAPRTRLLARKLSVFWAHVEAGSRAIGDPLCGYRVYPIDRTLTIEAPGDHMEWEPGVAVRLLWASTPVVHVPTRVRYLTTEEGGVSHFRLFRDNARISWMHTRLMMEKTLQSVGALLAP